MSVTALFKGKWWSKSPDTTEKTPAPVTHHSHEEEDDEDDSKSGFNRETSCRNSRFYRSMRKKKPIRPEQPDSSRLSSDQTSFSRTAGLSSVPPRHQTPSPRDRRPSPQLHPHTIVLPSNGKAGSGHNRQAVELRRGGRGGWSESTSPVSVSQQTDFSAGMGLYRAHMFPNQHMDKLCDHTTRACSVQEVPGRNSGSECAQNHADHRFLREEDHAHPPSHSLKMVYKIGFLYQEYRDSSEQQEIEDRRQRDSRPPVGAASGGSWGSSVASPPALQLQLRKCAHSLSLWQNLEAVQTSGLLTQLPQKEIIMQEAMFELVTSEASYYKSLEVLETHFLQNLQLVNTLNQSDMHFLFSNIEEVMEASERFLMDLENRIEQSVQISDVCDIVYYHAVQNFHVFIKYVINQGYQETNYRRLLEGNQAFRETMASLETHPRVRGLTFTSFLILPFQRITRLKMLVQNILKKADENSEREANAVKAHQQLEQIVKECNEGVRKMSRTEELISIVNSLEFKSKSVPVISHSRWLLKKGELQLMNGPKSTRTMRGKKLYHPIYLFLFNNLLLVTKRSSSGEKFQVLDSCTRAMLKTEDLEDQGQLLASIFHLKLLENHEDREVSYMLKCSSVSEKLRWIYALTPNRRTRFMPTNPHQEDTPQVQCIQSYTSQEHDELSIEMADVLNLLERTDDGWMMGERLHDGERGWFPSRVVEDIHSKEIRAQNLREVLRIQHAQEVDRAGQTPHLSLSPDRDTSSRTRCVTPEAKAAQGSPHHLTGCTEPRPCQKTKQKIIFAMRGFVIKISCNN
ncbi:ephexin-1 [Thalassophryne amazonica]|uniref:ephexin-1 n=1 Tax=Thalassophryne amazonica TaxID=390379 RepID=UPI0014717793|nr:ephexin-1 [Thalassophryne amazonica]